MSSVAEFLNGITVPDAEREEILKNVHQSIVASLALHRKLTCVLCGDFSGTFSDLYWHFSVDHLCQVPVTCATCNTVLPNTSDIVYHYRSTRHFAAGHLDWSTDLPIDDENACAQKFCRFMLAMSLASGVRGKQEFLHRMDRAIELMCPGFSDILGQLTDGNLIHKATKPSPWSDHEEPGQIMQINDRSASAKRISADELIRDQEQVSPPRSRDQRTVSEPEPVGSLPVASPTFRQNASSSKKRNGSNNRSGSHRKIAKSNSGARPAAQAQEPRAIPLAMELAEGDSQDSASIASTRSSIKKTNTVTSIGGISPPPKLKEGIDFKEEVMWYSNDNLETNIDVTCQLCLKNDCGPVYTTVQNQPKELKEHVFQHFHTALYQCMYCGAFKTKKEALMQSHVADRHPHGSVKNFQVLSDEYLTELAKLLRVCFPPSEKQMKLTAKRNEKTAEKNRKKELERTPVVVAPSLPVLLAGADAAVVTPKRKYKAAPGAVKQIQKDHHQLPTATATSSTAPSTSSSLLLVVKDSKSDRIDAVINEVCSFGEGSLLRGQMEREIIISTPSPGFEITQLIDEDAEMTDTTSSVPSRQLSPCAIQMVSSNISEAKTIAEKSPAQQICAVVAEWEAETHLWKHLAKVKKVYAYRCGSCSYGSPTGFMIQQHVTNVHNAKSVTSGKDFFDLKQQHQELFTLTQNECFPNSGFDCLNNFFNLQSAEESSESEMNAIAQLEMYPPGAEMSHIVQSSTSASSIPPMNLWYSPSSVGGGNGSMFGTPVMTSAASNIVMPIGLPTASAWPHSLPVFRTVFPMPAPTQGTLMRSASGMSYVNGQPAPPNTAQLCTASMSVSSVRFNRESYSESDVTSQPTQARLQL